MAAEGIALEPMKFYDKFFIPANPIVQGQGLTIINELIDEGCVNYLEDHQQQILDKAKEKGYGQNWKEATLISKMLTNYSAYFQARVGGQEVLQPGIYEEAKTIARAWQTDAYTKDYLSQAEHIQRKWEGEINGVQCHGTTDFVVEGATEARVVDLKVVSIDPRRAARKYRWDIQGAFYTALVGATLGKKMLPAVFIVTEVDAPEHPLVFELSQESMITGVTGNETTPGYVELLRRYKWHKNNNLWDHSESYYKQGHSILNVL